jgi:hypothetical protein
MVKASHGYAFVFVIVPGGKELIAYGRINVAGRTDYLSYKFDL